MLLVKAKFSLFSYFRFPCLGNKLLKLKLKHHHNIQIMTIMTFCKMPGSVGTSPSSWRYLVMMDLKQDGGSFKFQLWKISSRMFQLYKISDC